KSAPGSHESAVLERIAVICEEAMGVYDLVIFDTAPTGHTVHLLSLPERLTGWAESLVANRDRSERFAAAARSLVSPKEETPGPDAQLRRTRRPRLDRFALLRHTIADAQQTGFLITALAERLPVAETLDLVRQLREIDVDLAGIVVNRLSPADSGDFLAGRRALEDEQLSQLHAAVDPLPVAELPLLAGELTGTEAVRQLADHQLGRAETGRSRSKRVAEALVSCGCIHFDLAPGFKLHLPAGVVITASTATT